MDPLNDPFTIKNSREVTRDPADLHVHKLIKGMAAWTGDDSRFEALCDDIAEHGIIEPLKITARNEIVDGRHRWRAAKRMQKPEVPCVMVEDDDILSIALSTLLHRRHYTASQRAYIIQPYMEEAWQQAARRRAMNAAKNEMIKFSFVSAGSKSPDEFAAEIGVSIQYLRQAREIHNKFAAHPEKRTQLTDSDDVTEKNVTLKAFFEARIFREEKPYGLGAVLAGISYILEVDKFPNKARGGKPKEVEKQFKLFNEVIDHELNRWDYWQKFDDQTKAEHFKRVRTKAATIADAEKLEALAEYHKKLAGEFARAAKQAREAAPEQN